MRPDDIGLVLEDFKQELEHPATPVVPEDIPLPSVQSPPPPPPEDDERTHAGFLKGLGLLVLCIAILVWIAKYLKGGADSGR